MKRGFFGSSRVKNLPANGGDRGSIPGPGRSHTPWSHNYWACAPPERPPQWEAAVPESSPHSPQLENRPTQLWRPSAAVNTYICKNLPFLPLLPPWRRWKSLWRRGAKKEASPEVHSGLGPSCRRCWSWMPPKPSHLFRRESRRMDTAAIWAVASHQSERSESKIAGTSGVLFQKAFEISYKKYLKKNDLHDWLHIVANSKESYKLCYFQINQDEEEEEDEN